MQISLDSNEGVYRILGYANGKIQINDQYYGQSLLVMPDTLVETGGRDSRIISPISIYRPSAPSSPRWFYSVPARARFSRHGS